MDVVVVEPAGRQSACNGFTLSRVTEAFMEELSNYLTGLLSGPGHLRFVIQPIVAMLLGARDGWNDAQHGKKPYLMLLAFSEGQRRALLHAGLKVIALPLVFAIVLDAILQLLIYDDIHPMAAVIMGTLLIAFPYSLSRGLANHLWHRVVKLPRKP